ncbi:MAG: ribonucleoside-diphosphate reductase beta chain [Thermoleophilaceae bacterium]|jgi:ribonucleoside-diphosphate reductase beta chain|nr:ribonucleoside-diphosphate reductase beta chain [Thermoleophilaceae bacterium]MEA2470638.1 ribonucleoside-diphosphate reductase beta chain [Thermoleophilaceae bacterium]
MSDMTTARTDRDDFQATRDPGLMHGADSGQVNLLSYSQLYELWERQQWRTQDLDFTQDRVDWHGFPAEERFQRMYGLSSFFIGEQKVADELGPMMRAAPTGEMRIFLCTQIADEARHVAFFNRFYDEVGVLESDNLQDRLEETSQHLNPQFNVLFDELLKDKVDRLARAPEDLETLVEAITLYHMIIEGMLALTGQHFIISYNEENGTLPGFVEGFNNVARDEHRHVAFGARFLREMAAQDSRYRDAIQRTLVECGPAADGVLTPPWYQEGMEVFGVSLEETRTFAMNALERRMKVIGLAPVA